MSKYDDEFCGIDMPGIDDYFDEPDQATDIVRKAIGDFSEQLKTGVKQVMEQAKNAEAEVNRLDKEIARKQCQLKHIDDQIAEAKEKAEKVERTEIPKILLEHMARYATGGFAPGDEAYIIDSDWHHTECCPVCGGAARLIAETVLGKKEIHCPHCSGRGRISKPAYRVKKVKIEDIRCTLCFDDSHRVNYWTLDSIGIRGRDWHRAENVYRTEKDAQAALEVMEASE